MHARLPSPPRRLSDLEREVLLKAAAREIAGVRDRRAVPAASRAARRDARASTTIFGGATRPSMTFERLLTRRSRARRRRSTAAPSACFGKRRFLAAAFRGYEARRDAPARVDEHALRAQLLETEPARPLRHVIVTVGERSVDPAGLWPADFDLLTRLPLLEQIDIVATQATIAAGLSRSAREIHAWIRGSGVAGDRRRRSDAPTQPVLMTAGDGQPFTVSRDREDELSAIARRAEGRPAPSDLDRRAVVFKRPLPYVYLARDVFADAGIPYQTFDALPLAAEPYAAALDLVFEFVTSKFTREPVVALLSSPHFSVRRRRRADRPARTSPR